MIKISHRGNIFGPQKEKENSPEYLWNAIESGYNVEADIWYIGKNFYFGHDAPEYKVDPILLFTMSFHTWFHCKNFDALDVMSNEFNFNKFFWHQQDDYTITSNGYIWTYPNKIVSKKSIIVVTDQSELSKYIDLDIYGVCSDYVGQL